MIKRDSRLLCLAIKRRLCLLKQPKDLQQNCCKVTKEGLVSDDSYILFVNDGSSDNTWSIIQQLYESNKYVRGVKLEGNVGHQNALMAGLSVVVDHCDIVITMDADLQDDVNAMQKMIMKYNGGENDIIYGVRASRATDSWFKRTTALGFYSLMKFMGVKSIYNHADYRLMSQRALRHLLSYRERNLFLRGMVPTIGYKSDSVFL